ncbi:hypothetical protein EC973_007463 [Apophysomyces ossiformis]|uniref:RRM domain-containing protein n=1 Tax=Apophysomyces ossiformis TaxID=679940 RepID=A0A8H7ERM6_9FUNG|nr:hypothetical protein EC973_007463 [Apophysomyces ossiformis]
MALFIGRIPREMNPRDLEDRFSKFGKITRLDVKQGFGFVEFEDKRDAEDALTGVNGSVTGLETAVRGAGIDSAAVAEIDLPDVIKAVVIVTEGTYRRHDRDYDRRGRDRSPRRDDYRSDRDYDRRSSRRDRDYPREDRERRDDGERPERNDRGDRNDRNQERDHE